MSEERKKKIKEKIISPQEKILAEFGVAKIYSGFWIFLGFLILIISVIVSLFYISDFWLAILFGLALIFYGFYLRLAYFYFITDKRLVYYYQFLHTQLISVDYQKITDLSVKENFLEKIFFGSGNLAINTAGGPKEEIIFSHIDNPHFIKRKIDEIISSQKQNIKERFQNT
jgi:uncharacterized membrane protein YdbT with pleckstrin-like domain